MDSNKENYASVSTRIKGYGRYCESVAEQPLFRGLGSMQAHPAQDLDDSKVPEWLKVYVTELDRKLDHLLGMQSKKDLKEDFPLNLEIIKISGNGMTFKSDDIKKPCIIESVIEIEHIPLRLAGAIGQLQAGKSINIWTMTFDNIRENDFESIIQFVFSEQRELIRSEKNRGTDR